MADNSTIKRNKSKTKESIKSPQNSDPILIIEVTETSATIYRSIPIWQKELPISINESASLGMSICPNWWENEQYAPMLRELVFTLGGQGKMFGLHILPKLTNAKHSRKADRYLITSIVKGGEK